MTTKYLVNVEQIKLNLDFNTFESTKTTELSSVELPNKSIAKKCFKEITQILKKYNQK